MTEYAVGSLPYELQNIALGACFLGSGGGGGLDTSFNYIDKYCQGGINNNLEITDLNTAQGPGIVVAYMGAPQKVGDVKCPDAICDGVKKFETDMKKKDPNFNISYIIPIEIGPVSMVAACLAAHRMGKAVLDVDGAGRAVPTLDLITYGTNAGISVNPTILCSENHHQITLEISEEIFDEKDDALDDSSTMESLARPVLCLPLFDQKAGLVMWYFDDVTTLKEKAHACVPGTLTFCRELGGTIQSMQGKKGVLPDVEKLLLGKLSSDKSIYTDIKEFCHGTLDSATTLTSGGFDVGVITIKDGPKHVYKIVFQNESLILWDSNSAQPLIMAPHLISYLIDDDNGRYVFTNGDIMRGDALKKELKGAKIVVYGIAAPSVFGTDKMQSNIMRVLGAVGYYGNDDPIKHAFDEPLKK